MKKVIAGVIAVAFIGMVFLGTARAASVMSIGYIDVQKVFAGYKETSKAQEQLKKEEEEFKKDFEARQKKLEEENKKGKSKAEVDELTKKLEEELLPKREKLLKMSEELTVKLQRDIVGSVKEVSKNLGLDLVLDKQVIIDGGIDITDMVINKLNKK